MDTDTACLEGTPINQELPIKANSKMTRFKELESSNMPTGMCTRVSSKMAGNIEKATSFSKMADTTKESSTRTSLKEKAFMSQATDKSTVGAF